MKIVLISYRHWTAGREFRSLILNAKRLGHQLWGFAEIQHGDAPLTIAAYRELGIEGYPGDELQSRIDEIDPDLVFGGRSRPWFIIERLGQDWANEHNKIGLILNHIPVLPSCGCQGGPYPGSRSHLICSNESQAEDCASPNCESHWPEPSIWSKEQIHILGPAGFDVAFEQMDASAIRARLDTKPDQPLIGLFTDLRDRRPSRGAMIRIAQEAKQRDWKLVIHPWPMARRLQHSDSKVGFFNRPDVAETLLKLQDLGAIIVADYAPGTVMGVKFRQCKGFELETVADCLLSTSFDVFFEAYAIKKRCHSFWAELSPDFIGFTHEIIDLGFETGFDNDVDKIVAVLERDRDLEYIEHDPKIIKKWFHKLDGLWWQRALNLATKLN